MRDVRDARAQVNQIPGATRATPFTELAWAVSPALRARVLYAATWGRWQMSAFGRADNIFGRRYAGSVIVNDGHGRYFEPTPGRTWLAGASAALSF